MTGLRLSNLSGPESVATGTINQQSQGDSRSCLIYSFSHRSKLGLRSTSSNAIIIIIYYHFYKNTAMPLANLKTITDDVEILSPRTKIRSHTRLYNAAASSPSRPREGESLAINLKSVKSTPDSLKQRLSIREKTVVGRPHKTIHIRIYCFPTIIFFFGTK